MKMFSPALIALTVGIGTFCTLSKSAGAQQRLSAEYSVVITSVEDDFNVFNGLLSPGIAVNGHYDYAPAQLGNFTLDPYTAFHISNGPDAAHLSFVTGTLALNSSFFNLVITNDKPGSGDEYSLVTQTDYPNSFAQPDPDVYIVSYPIIKLRLHDASGTALASLDTPLTLPSLNQFTEADGTLSVIVDDVNTGDEFISKANFRLTILAATVPEPGTAALLTAGLLGGSLLRLRRRKANIPS